MTHFALGTLIVILIGAIALALIIGYVVSNRLGSNYSVAMKKAKADKDNL